jgi:UDP-N-acetylmuramate: L-alanyl-gamma-D-glutamyl-meso-diaminopimelate ligase
LVRTIPQQGLIITPGQEPAIEQTLAMGCWTARETTFLTHSANSEQQTTWSVQDINPQHFEVFHHQQSQGIVRWNLSGAHNRQNAIAAIAAANHAGIAPPSAIAALNQFKGVKRRLELLAQNNGITIYDDFAHHPTAIQLTLEGLRKQLGDSATIIAIIEPRSNTMRMGIHAQQLINALSYSDQSWIYQAPNLDWSLDELLKNQSNIHSFTSNSALITALLDTDASDKQTEQHWVFMSNGAFAGIYQQAIAAIQS